MVLMNRKLRDKIPHLDKTHNIFNDAWLTDNLNKSKSKHAYDEKRHVKPGSIVAGDFVLIKQKRKNKLSTNYSSLPYRVTNVSGPAITVVRGHQQFTRNVADVKKIPHYTPPAGDTDASDWELASCSDGDRWEPPDSDQSSSTGDDDVNEQEDRRDRPVRDVRAPERFGDFVAH